MITNKVAPRTNIVMVRGKRMYLAGGKLYALGGEMEEEKSVGGAAGMGALSGAMSGMSAGPIGAIAGALIGGVGGAIGASSENAQKLQEYNMSKQREKDRREEIAKTINSSYPTHGVAGLTTMYSLGGKFAQGDMMQQPIQTMQQGVQPQQFQTAASNVQEVQGPVHEQGGVNAGNGNEVEGGEVIQAAKDGSSQVFSNRLPVSKGVTFADKASELAKQKGKYEQLLNDKSLFARGTARRQVDKIDAQLAKLFQMQEQMKQAMIPPQPTPEQQMQEQQEQTMGENVMAQDAMQSTQPMQPQTQQQFALGGNMNGGDPPDWLKQYYKNLKLASDNSVNNPENATYKQPRTLGKMATDAGMVLKQSGYEPEAIDDKAVMDNMQTALGNATQEEGAGVTTKERKPINMQKVGAYIERAVPFVDNAVNAILTANTPRVPKPNPERTVPLKTTFNINPQLAAIDATEANTAEQMRRSTSDAATYRANLIAGKAGLVSQRNALYGQKENTETGLINQNAMNVQGITNRNIAKEDQYDLMNMQREGEIQSRISANVTNAVEDSRMQTMQDNLQKRDYLELEVLKQQYKDSGVYDRNLDAMMTAYSKGDITWEEFNERVLKVYGAPKATKEGGK